MYEIGQNVRVVKDCTCEEYVGLHGVVAFSRVHDPLYPYFVHLSNGARDIFREDELAPADIRIIEGVVEVDGDASGITMVTVGDEDIYNWLWVNGLDGKHVTVTVVVREGE